MSASRTALTSGKPMLDVLSGRAPSRRPIWFMRQAGRYLKEYKEVRAKAGSFLDLCYDPALAAEVTLQPIRRFGFDAAIIFADILLIPHALGRNLSFQTGEGPVLDPIATGSEVAALDISQVNGRLESVFETLDRVSGELPGDVALIGFCGSPWTVATYMIAGRGSPDQRMAREAMYRAEPWFSDLMDVLVEASVEYLCGQVDAGAEVLQLFDTWAGILSPDGYRRWCIEPTRRIIEGVKAKHPDIPVTGFPRGSGLLYAEFVEGTGVDAVGLDWTVPVEWASEVLVPKVPVQGNLDPVALCAGGNRLDREVDAIVEGFEPGTHIFNLGHGILPETPLEHVSRVLDRVRSAD